jgi:hypothetical protein
MWKIGDPAAVLTMNESSTKASDLGVRDDETMMTFQLMYDISSTPRYARYRILQKNCREYYNPGHEPVMAKAPVAKDTSAATAVEGGEKNRHATMYIPTISPSATDENGQTVVATFVAKNPRRGSSQDEGIEFCVRLGLFLPPEAGEMEVNFRETNVKLSFQVIDNDTGNGNGDERKKEGDAQETSTTSSSSLSLLSSVVDMIWSYVEYIIPLQSTPVRLKSVDVEPCPLREVDIKLFGQMHAKEQPRTAEEAEEEQHDQRLQERQEQDTSEGDDEKEGQAAANIQADIVDEEKLQENTAPTTQETDSKEGEDAGKPENDEL